TSLIPNIFASVAQWESEVNSQRTRDALMQKFRDGWQPTPPPMGYQSVGGDRERKTCEPDPYVAPIIKELFELYATGNYSIYELQNWLAEQNIVSNSGKTVGHTTIDTILNNPFYYGLIRWRGESKIGNHLAIIGKELFDTCQYVLAKHRNFMMRKRTHEFLLRGFVYCSECGQRYTAEWHKNEKKFAKRGGKIGYYHCPKLGRNGCPAPYVEMDDLEKLIEETIKQIQFSQEFIDAVVNKAREFLAESRKRSGSEIQGCANQKNALEAKRNKLEDALLDGTIDREVFKRKHGDIQKQLQLVDSRLQEIQDQTKIDIDLIEEVLAFTRNIGQTYKEAPMFLQRHYLRFFYEKILVKKKHIHEVIYTPIFASLQANHQVIIMKTQLPLKDLFINRDIEFDYDYNQLKILYSSLQDTHPEIYQAPRLFAYKD
ncbi:hypothetical protein GYA19_01955, partial [Candidatus Beckwithbacteria bacterium]|nr:hypothetical protein [Candidatus Beckwithbacteria bacterium]